MILGMIACMLIGLLAGRCLRSRSMIWLVIVGGVICGHYLTLGEDPILRMGGLCVVLLAGMKGLVYHAWGGRLSWRRYFIFSLLWFGMDPGTFRYRRAGLSWKSDVMWGFLLMGVGTIGAWVVWMMEWRQILVMFLPLSLGFHFGALRVLKGIHRLAGFPVRTLFPNLLKTTGVSDFWSRRWNVGYSQMMQRVIGRPVSRRWGRQGGVCAVFVVSGLLHEVAITLPVQAGWGLPSVYFLVHGGLTILEEKFHFQLGRVVTLLLVMAPLAVLFPPAFQEEVIVRCLMIFE